MVVDKLKLHVYHYILLSSRHFSVMKKTEKSLSRKMNLCKYEKDTPNMFSNLP